MNKTIIEIGKWNDDWQQYDYFKADLNPSQDFTFNYESSLFDGLEKIKSSGSLTVKFPRTTHNDNIFSLALRVQYVSDMTHRRFPCRVYNNGIEITSDGFCYLLDCSNEYEAVIVFGLMRNYSTWLDNKPKLSDLGNNNAYIAWNKQAAFTDILVPAGQPAITPLWYGTDNHINTYTPANGIGKLMYYGDYTPGFVRDYTNINLANVHPFVTMREIYERIIAANSLDFQMPADVLLDMEDMAVVLTSRNVSAQGSPHTDMNYQSAKPTKIRLSSALVFGWRINMDHVSDCYVNGGGYYGKNKIKYKGDAGLVNVQIFIQMQDNTSYPYQGVNRSVSYILNDVGHLDYLNLKIKPTIGSTLTLTPTYTPAALTYSGTLTVAAPFDAVEGDEIAEMWIDNDILICNYVDGAFNDNWTSGDWSGKFPINTAQVNVIFYDSSTPYPNPNFYCFPNLPDITQYDFIKSICVLYGLFPVQSRQVTGHIEFVPIDKLEENKIQPYDWSKKLVATYDGCPKKTSFHIGSFARHNWLEWKEDGEDYIADETRRGSIDIDDVTLDKDYTFASLPYAATDGWDIPHYKIVTETDNNQDPPVTITKAEFTKLVPRIMRVTSWVGVNGATATHLEFLNLSAPAIIAQRYAALSALLNRPRVITEAIRLNELDIRDFDFARPVFLSQYGRFFAVKKIQYTTSAKTAEVEMILLP